MRKIYTLALLALGIVGATPADGQVLPVALEARGGLAFPLNDFPTGGAGGGEGAQAGAGFGVNASFSFLPGLAVYGGWDRYAFGVDTEGGAGEDAEFVDKGFAVGGLLSLPVATLAGVSPWVRGGALFRTLDLSDGGADLGSERSTGFEVGGGVTIPLGLVLSFTPGVTYRAYSPQFGDDSEGSVKYVDVSLGLRARF